MVDDANEPLAAPRYLPGSAATLTSFEHEVQLWNGHLLQAAETMPLSEEGSIAYVCRLAADLHLATTSAIGFTRSRLQTRCDDTFNVMRALPDSVWEALRTLHIRM